MAQRTATPPGQTHGGGERYRNMGTTDRVLSAMIAAWMLTRRRKRQKGLGKAAALASGALFIKRAATGHSAVYERLGVSSVGLAQGAGINVEAAVTILAPREQIYEFMRDFSNLPLVFTHAARVEPLDEDSARWTLEKTPGSMEISWVTRMLNERPDEYLAWQSAEGEKMEQAGSMHFKSVGEKGTEVTVKLRYRPPAGAPGFAVGKLLNAVTAQQLGADLRNLKRLMETGDLITTEGQPSGRSGRSGRSSQVSQRWLEAPEPPKQPEPVVVPAYAADTGLLPGEPVQGAGAFPAPLESVPAPFEEIDPLMAADRRIESAAVPAIELEREITAAEGIDAARPVALGDDDET